MSFSHHRRSQSEMHFRIPNDFDLEVDLSPPHHFQDPVPSNSPDASSSSLVDAIDAEKALSPYKLAQLWTVDPKRAKRYRDTTGLTTENTELKLRLQGMEQQANLCDALKNEVDRLKIATGEIVMHTDAYDIPYDLSEMLSSESIGQFQGLDIGNGVSHNLMPDCPSICVNNINNAF
ncbi:hypothetical protein GLYMA_06G143200v4 [Glycine max]|uniref:BZIP domain-containing protein n=1 Tax=Glycine max TaxID=3847 RepID=K7KV16_SOYBN|nr:hypothetical protein GYH30_015083 [Glycine max]KRH53733.1 hypothetical protein GLYMA_06G143200v4 [Glycine max]